MSHTFDILHLIVILAASAFGGVFIALFSYFLDYCFWPNNVFSFYLPWLARTVLKKRSDFEAIKVLPDQELIDLAANIGRFKLFGGCVVCFNIWHCFVSFGLIYAFVDVPFWCLLPYSVTSSFVIRKLVGAD